MKRPYAMGSPGQKYGSTDMVICMRTTLNLDDHLFRAAKKLAAERGITLTQVVEDALRAALNASTKGKPYRLRMFTVKGKGPLPVDVADRNALYDWLEAPAKRTAR
ncbi:MAG: hypothetical protein ACRDKS_02140 [Actinomycetota bacterium]